MSGEHDFENEADEGVVNGDPSRDVSQASVIFLVDAKLVLLQPSTTHGDLRYDMRVIAHNVEYFDLIRDRHAISSNHSPLDGIDDLIIDRGLKDSLWYFNGHQLCCWIDTNDFVRNAPSNQQTSLPEPISIATDFYPTSTSLESGVVLGLDADLVQPRDINLAAFRLMTRVSHSKRSG